MTIISPGLVNRKGAERGNIDISSTQIHDHSLSGLVNRKGAEEETSISLAHKYMTTLSPGLVNRKGVERGNIDISRTQIHDHSLSWLGQ